MKLILAFLLLFCTTQTLHAQEDGVVALALPVRNALKFNRYVINPTFSLVREQNTYISITNKREWVQFENAPETYLASYSGRFSENIGVGIGLFQQKYGVLNTFGGLLNFAYNVNLQTDSNLTFGLNVGFYKSGIDAGAVVTNDPEPSLETIPSNSLLTINPGLNYGTGFFDFGVSINNLVLYNINASEMIQDNPEQAIQTHIMYTGYMDTRGFFDESKFSGLVKSEFKKEKTVLSGIAMLTVPKGIWAQAGYNTLYGVSGGMGINISTNIAIEYNFEKSIGDLATFGPSHEVTLAYKFNSKKNYFYSGDDDDEVSLFARSQRAKRRKAARSKPILDSAARAELAEARAQEIADKRAQAELDIEARKQERLAAREEIRLAAEAREQERLDRLSQSDAEAKAKLAAEAKALADAEEQARLAALAKAEADEQARLAAAEAKSQAEADERARLAAQAEDNAEAQERARLAAIAKAEADEQARLAAAEAKAKAEADERARLAAQAEANAEAQERARLAAIAKAEADEQARLAAQAEANAEAQERARLAALAKAEADEQARLAAAEAKAKADAEEQARLAAQAEANAEAQERARLAALAKAEADEQARLAAAEANAEAQERARLAAIAKAEADEQARLAAAEAKAKADAEEQARLAAQAQANAEAQERARLAAIAKAEADEQARLAAAEAKAKADAEEQARLAEQAQANAEAQERARLAAIAKAEADEQARLAAAEAKAKAEADEQARLAALAKAKADEQEQARLAALAKAEAKAQAEADEQARLAALAKAKADEQEQARLAALAKAEAEEQERLAAAAAIAKAEADERARLAAEASAKAEAEAESRLAVNATDEIAQSMKRLAESTKNSEEIQKNLLTGLSEITKSKEKDLSDLKEENDLSEKGIFRAPKPFKSVSAENRKLEALTSELNNLISDQDKRIAELEALYNERLKKVKDKNDPTNLYYRNAIATLKSEQLTAVRTRASLLSTLEEIKVAIEIERKRRIKRAAYDDEEDRLRDDREALQMIKENTQVSPVPLKAEIFNFGEELSSNIQILKNIKNVENGFYMVLAVHGDEGNRDDFLIKAVSAGESNIDFFFDVKTNKYYIYHKKFNSIQEANNALKAKGNKPYNGKMSIVKIE